jgi:hypothetical protein
MEDLQGAGTVTSALHYRIRSCQILVTGKQQEPRGDKTRTRSGSAASASSLLGSCGSTSCLRAASSALRQPLEPLPPRIAACRRYALLLLLPCCYQIAYSLLPLDITYYNSQHTMHSQLTAAGAGSWQRLAAPMTYDNHNRQPTADGRAAHAQQAAGRRGRREERQETGEQERQCE